MRRSSPAAAALLLALSLGACRDPAGVETSPLAGTAWRLSQVGGAAVIQATARETPGLWLDPSSHNASGNGGCNAYGAAYTVLGASLRFSNLVSTAAACLRFDLNQQEGALMLALRDTRSWRIDGRTLVLLGDAGELARFNAEAHG